MKMMSINNYKRKGRLNANSNKLGKSKFYPEKIILNDGIYGNSKLMYTAASLVGCVVQIQVQNGAVFEGVLRTFSHQLDVVLEMAHKVNSKSSPAKGISPVVSNLIESYPFEGGIFDKLIFKLSDIILMVASTVDLDYAVKDNFTDAAITKFNGQVKERELEPWEDAESDSEGTLGLSIEDEEGTNGWDANDMFRTNAEKYGVTSSYDNSLQDYTVPLTKKDTEEYKLQEAKALKIAQEIETNNSYQSRIQLEDGDEEDRFSAVVRPVDEPPTAPSKYVLPQKRRNTPGIKRQPTPLSLPVSANSSKLYQTSSSSQSSLSILDETSGPLLPPSSSATGSSNIVTVPKTAAVIKNASRDAPIVRENSVSPLECTNSDNSLAPSVSSIMPPMYSTQTLPPRIERRRENEKKFSKHKGRTDEIEEFKKFSTNFKLTDERDLHESAETSESKAVECLESKTERTQIGDEEEKSAAAANVVKYSTLNPNAKEFVFNPNAKSFTPRSMSVVTPPTPAQPHPTPAMQDQNSLMAVPPSQMIPQPIFTAIAPQYMMQAAPVSVAITSPFASGTPVPPPAPRFRKNTGQPLLTPSGIPTPSQLAVQYSSPPGVLHASAPTQQTVGYPQMNFVIGPRVVSPQPVGVIPTSHSVSYCDTSHLPTHLIMSAHPSASHTQANNTQPLQQGSSHHPPQCHTPVLHPAPSPVHPVPPPSHSQPPTPTTVIYPGGGLGQHPLHQAAGHHSHNHHPMHHGAYPTGPPQPLMLMQQQQPPVSASHPAHHSLHMHHPLHSQAAGVHHVGGPTHLLPQMTIIPTSAAMTSASTPPYIQHP